jgi:hypothetical protein
MMNFNRTHSCARFLEKGFACRIDKNIVRDFHVVVFIVILPVAEDGCSGVNNAIGNKMATDTLLNRIKVAGAIIKNIGNTEPSWSTLKEATVFWTFSVFCTSNGRMPSTTPPWARTEGLAPDLQNRPAFPTD